MRPNLLTAALGALLLPQAALAQDADTFNFAGSSFDHQGSLQLAHPAIGQADSSYLGLGMAYAQNPLVLRYANGDETVVVGGQFSTRLQGGYTIGELLRADIEIPIYPAIKVNGENTFAVGPIGLSALVPLLRYEGDGLGFAVKPTVHMPTGSGAKDAFVSGGFSAGVAAVVGGNAGNIGWRANLGLDLSGKDTLDSVGNGIDPLAMGSALQLGAGFDYVVIEELLVGAELTSRTDIAEGFGPWNASPMEGHLYGTWGGEEGLQATLGFGAGLLAGVGAPDFRIVAAGGWRFPGGPKDTDLDGIPDEVDACIDTPEDIDSFEDTDGCPDADNDFDGVPDTDDGCPMEPEDKDAWEDTDGCPDPDNDGDTIIDPMDECPDVAGPKATKGCPDNDADGLANKIDACPDEPGPANTKGCPDRDSDRVPDRRDQCPDEPIDPRADPERSNGCPTRVVVTKEKIEILDVIYFNVNKTTIQSKSFPLLADIAQVINDNPDITRIEVAGHTDSDGNDAFNLKLSQGRAEAVVQHLSQKGGVDAGRLVPVGYGETKPVVPNDSTENKAKNRRVEFVILERDGSGPGTRIEVAPSNP